MTRRWQPEEIAGVLPQAPPILMLDELEQDEAGALLGRTSLTAGHWCHSEPFAFPAIYFIEQAMQALTCALLSRPALRGKFVVFAGIKSATFLGRPRHGDVLETRVLLESLTRDRAGAFQFESAVAGQLLARGSVRVAVVAEEELRDVGPLQVQDLGSWTSAPARAFDQLLGSWCGELPELLLTRLCASTPGVLRAAAVAAGDSWVMRGHFKTVRILNGLFLLQMCEQMLALAGQQPRLRLCGVQGVLFKKINHPGDLVLLQVRPAPEGVAHSFEVRAHSENAESMKATLRFEPVPA